MPIHLLSGTDDFLMEQALLQLRQDTLDPAFSGFNHKVLKNPSLAAALEAVGSVSLAFGTAILIECHQFKYLYEAVHEGFIEKQLEELKALLTNLDPNKVVVFVNPKTDGKIKFTKWLGKYPGIVVKKFDSFNFWEHDKAVQFLGQYANSRQIAIQPQAIDKLVMTVGLHTRQLVNELVKLSLYAKNRTITLDDVNRMSYHSDNLFEVVNRLILQVDPKTNYEDLWEMLLRRHPVELFAVIQGYFLNMFRTLWLFQKGYSVDHIAEQTGQKPFTIKKNIDRFRYVPLQHWVNLKEALLNLEWKAKSGGLDGQLALEVFLATKTRPTLTTGRSH